MLAFLPVTLRSLEATFVGRAHAKGYHELGDLFTQEAQGVLFLCPLRDGHSICVWFKDRGVPAGLEPLNRWAASGTSLDDLSITPSINLDVGPQASCKWHGFVTKGMVQ